MPLFLSHDALLGQVRNSTETESEYGIMVKQITIDSLDMTKYEKILIR